MSEKWITQKKNERGALYGTRLASAIKRARVGDTVVVPFYGIKTDTVSGEIMEINATEWKVQTYGAAGFLVLNLETIRLYAIRLKNEEIKQ